MKQTSCCRQASHTRLTTALTTGGRRLEEALKSLFDADKDREKPSCWPLKVFSEKGAASSEGTVWVAWLPAGR